MARRVGRSEVRATDVVVRVLFRKKEDDDGEDEDEGEMKTKMKMKINYYRPFSPIEIIAVTVTDFGSSVFFSLQHRCQRGVTMNIFHSLLEGSKFHEDESGALWAGKQAFQDVPRTAVWRKYQLFLDGGFNGERRLT